MGLSQALYSGVSGLINHNRCMDNIGNNIANINTVGFKKGLFQFSTILEQVYRGGAGVDAAAGRGAINPVSLGLGTQTASINKLFTQGNLETTGDPKHLAIDGNGFFVLGMGNGVALTRDGTFYIAEYPVGSEKQQVLMANGGLPVLGYRANDYGVITPSSPLESIQIELGRTGGARETSAVSFSGNLKSNQLVAMGVRIVDGTMVNPPDWLGRNLQTTDATWPALAANAAANIPSVINGGAVNTSGALAVEAWRISALDYATLGGGGTLSAGMFQKAHISADASLNDNANWVYFGVTDSTAKAADLANTLNAGGTPPGPPTHGLQTNLRDIFYFDGTGWIKPFAGIRNGDQITVSWSMGAASDGMVRPGEGVRNLTATFVYNNPNEIPFTLDPTRSFTLEHWAKFMAGDVDSPTVVALQQRYAGRVLAEDLTGLPPPPGVHNGFLHDPVAGTYQEVYVDGRNRVVNRLGQFIDPATIGGDLSLAAVVPEDQAVTAIGLFRAEEDANFMVTADGYVVIPLRVEDSYYDWFSVEWKYNTLFKDLLEGDSR